MELASKSAACADGERFTFSSSCGGDFMEILILSSVFSCIGYFSINLSILSSLGAAAVESDGIKSSVSNILLRMVPAAIASVLILPFCTSFLSDCC